MGSRYLLFPKKLTSMIFILLTHSEIFYRLHPSMSSRNLCMDMKISSIDQCFRAIFEMSIYSKVVHRFKVMCLQILYSILPECISCFNHGSIFEIQVSADDYPPPTPSSWFCCSSMLHSAQPHKGQIPCTSWHTQGWRGPTVSCSDSWSVA